MAVPASVRERFERRYGCSLGEASRSLRSVAHLVSEFGAKEGPLRVGRGYVAFGEAIDAEEKDRQNRQILKDW